MLSSLSPREATEILIEKARPRARGGGDNLSLVVKLEPLGPERPHGYGAAAGHGAAGFCACGPPPSALCCSAPRSAPRRRRGSWPLAARCRRSARGGPSAPACPAAAGALPMPAGGARRTGPGRRRAWLPSPAAPGARGPAGPPAHGRELGRLRCCFAALRSSISFGARRRGAGARRRPARAPAGAGRRASALCALAWPVEAVVDREPLRGRPSARARSGLRRRRARRRMRARSGPGRQRGPTPWTSRRFGRTGIGFMSGGCRPCGAPGEEFRRLHLAEARHGARELVGQRPLGVQRLRRAPRPTGSA